MRCASGGSCTRLARLSLSVEESHERTKTLRRSPALRFRSWHDIAEISADFFSRPLYAFLVLGFFQNICQLFGCRIRKARVKKPKTAAAANGDPE